MTWWPLWSVTTTAAGLPALAWTPVHPNVPSMNDSATWTGSVRHGWWPLFTASCNAVLCCALSPSPLNVVPVVGVWAVDDGGILNDGGLLDPGCSEGPDADVGGGDTAGSEDAGGAAGTVEAIVVGEAVDDTVDVLVHPQIVTAQVAIPRIPTMIRRVLGPATGPALSKMFLGIGSPLCSKCMICIPCRIQGADR
ncbi:MAG: hypothetical protein JWN03_5145 [Nocardia sp.]|nr:hypothetical protein [Nocardia sp.]